MKSISIMEIIGHWHQGSVLPLLYDLAEHKKVCFLGQSLVPAKKLKTFTTYVLYSVFTVKLY